jgi:hypothetical protein
MTNQETQSDPSWMVPSLIFAKALGIILDEGQGIVIDLTENTKITGHEHVEKVIVYRKDEQVHIAPCEDPLEQGSVLTISINSDETSDETSEETI